MAKRRHYAALFLVVVIAIAGGLASYLAQESRSSEGTLQPESIAASTTRPTLNRDSQSNSSPPSSSPPRNPTQLPRQRLPVAADDMSFEKASDLFSLVARSAGSNEWAKSLNALSAMSACIDADILQDKFGHLFNATPTDAAQREVARAATLVLSRCRGFINNDLAAVVQMRDRKSVV